MCLQCRLVPYVIMGGGGDRVCSLSKYGAEISGEIPQLFLAAMKIL